jgi:hypothetical protein
MAKTTVTTDVALPEPASGCEASPTVIVPERKSSTSTVKVVPARTVPSSCWVTAPGPLMGLPRVMDCEPDGNDATSPLCKTVPDTVQPGSDVTKTPWFGARSGSSNPLLAMATATGSPQGGPAETEPSTTATDSATPATTANRPEIRCSRRCPVMPTPISPDRSTVADW